MGTDLLIERAQCLNLIASRNIKQTSRYHLLRKHLSRVNHAWQGHATKHGKKYLSFAGGH